MTAPAPKVSLWGLLETVALLAGLGGLAAPISWLACRVSSAPWWAELPAHFLDHALLGLALASAVWLRRWVPPRVHRGLAVTLAVAGLWPFAPARYTAPRAAPGTLSVLIANVHTANRDTASLLALARDRDVVGLLEVDAFWARAVVAGLPEHRVLASEPRSDNFGVMLLARIPEARAQVVDLGLGLPSIDAELPFGDAPIRLLLTHPLPPISAEYTRDRDRQLEALGARAATLGPRAIVTGDLNATPHVPALAALFAAGLRDGREGHGRLGTWPAPLGPLGIPIDHLLLGVSLAVPTLDAVAFGSDHRALRFTLGLRAGAGEGG